METLKASGKEFNCHPTDKINFYEFDDLLDLQTNFIPSIKDLGFVVVRNLFPKFYIDEARDAYFNLFKDGEYKKENGNWINLKNHKDSHGCNLHPSKSFLNTDKFLNIINFKKLNDLSSMFLKTKKSILSPRMIVRSFSRLSERCTYAHRDKEYFQSPNPSNVITCWIPLGPVGEHNGQLIYLKNSHKKESIVDNFVKKDKIISQDFDQISKDLNLNWIRPLIKEGDVIFHSLEIIHASFDSNSDIPRLSIDLRFVSTNQDNDPRWSNSWRGDDGI